MRLQAAMFFNHFLYENALKLKKECHPEIPWTYYLPNEPKMCLKFDENIKQKFHSEKNFLSGFWILIRTRIR
jgi:hypothetical protein